MLALYNKKCHMIIMLAPDSKKVAVEISRYMFDISCISCISKLFHQYLIFCFRPDRREPFPKAPLTQLIIDHCKYILSDSHFVNSIELKKKNRHTYINFD